MNKINIGNQKIGNVFKPFIIAEMSGNHNQSLEKALEIVDAAADAGAHAIKLQTYTADTITIDKKKESFSYQIQKVFGKGSLYTIFIKKLIRHGNGMNQFLNVRKKRELSVLVLLLILLQLIFWNL